MNKNVISIYIVALLFTLACNNSNTNHEHENEDKHEHDEESNHVEHDDHIDELEYLSYTLLSDEYELFVEFHPLIVGEHSEFRAHFTKMPEYKPIQEGQLTLSIIQGGEELKNRIDSPSVPGIFLAELQPDVAGVYTLVFQLEVGQRNTVFKIKNVEVFESEDLALHAAVHENEEGGITYLKEQAWKTEFATEQINKADFREVISTSGQIMPANGDETTLVSPFAGIVNIKGALVEGKYVKKGQELLSFSGKGLASDNISVHYTHLNSNLEKTKADYERLKGLVENKIVSEKDFLEAKAAYDKAKADFENASFTSDGKNNNIRANLSGYIKDILVSDGQFVEAGTPLVKIAQNKRLLVRADVSQNHWHCLPDIVEANFVTPYDSKLYNTKELNGKLISYSRNASNSAWSTPVFFEINNKGNLIPGTFIEVYLLSKPNPNVIAIPNMALIEEQGNFFVFVQLSGEKYEKREVKTGSGNGREIEIISGIQSGEIIVTKGAYQLKLASVSSALPSHAHNH